MKYLGIDLGGINVAAAVVDEAGTILSRGKISTPRTGAEAVAAAMAEAARQALTAGGFTMDDIASVGIGSPASLTPRTASWSTGQPGLPQRAPGRHAQGPPGQGGLHRDDRQRRGSGRVCRRRGQGQPVHGGHHPGHRRGRRRRAGRQSCTPASTTPVWKWATSSSSTTAGCAPAAAGAVLRPTPPPPPSSSGPGSGCRTTGRPCCGSWPTATWTRWRPAPCLTRPSQGGPAGQGAGGGVPVLSGLRHHQPDQHLPARDLLRGRPVWAGAGETLMGPVGPSWTGRTTPGTASAAPSSLWPSWATTRASSARPCCPCSAETGTKLQTEPPGADAAESGVRPSAVFCPAAGRLPCNFRQNPVY